MAWRTCFSSISYYGYKLDILKSGLQKYLRRREETKMLWCLGEIYLFHVFAKTQQEKRCARGNNYKFIKSYYYYDGRRAIVCGMG